MQYIDPYEEIRGYIPLMHPDSMDDPFKVVEEVGRVAYKSEQKITPDSAKAFVKKMVDHRHMSVSEFSNIVISIINPEFPIRIRKKSFLRTHKSFNTNGVVSYVGGSLRAWMEELNFYDVNFIMNKIQDGLEKFDNIKFVVTNDACPMSLRRFLVKFVNDRAFTHELVRHRVMSFLQESQRYVKYDGGLQVIKPAWFEFADNVTISMFTEFMESAESRYKFLRQAGLAPQSARGIIPNAVKTEIFVAGYQDGWQHLYDLRSAPGAHPDMKRSMSRLMESEKFKDLIMP